MCCLSKTEIFYGDWKDYIMEMKIVVIRTQTLLIRDVVSL